MSQRAILVQAVVDAAAGADWAGAEAILIWFAQTTDAFGGLTVTVTPPGEAPKSLPVAVVDIDRTFDVCVQELGHAFGFGHERDAADVAYRSPYSSMSSPRVDAQFIRPQVDGLPQGTLIGGVDVQQIVGPRLPGAQLVGRGDFRSSGQVRTLPAGWGRDPVTLRVHPPNYRDQHDSPPATLVVVPSRRPGDTREFFVELRRGHVDYDRGIGVSLSPPPTNRQNVPAGLTVHSVNPDGAVRYDGVSPVANYEDMRDWICPAGDFTLRYLSIGTQESWADIEIRRGSLDSFPVRGALLLGGFRTQSQLNSMSRDAMRNTLIVELTTRTASTDYQRLANDEPRRAGNRARVVPHPRDPQ